MRGGEKWLAPLFLGMAVFLRHRTIWVALIFGIMTLFFTDRRLFRRLIPILVISVVVIAAITAVSGEDLQSTKSQFAESAQDEGTFMWRVASWKALVYDKDQTLFTEMLGKSVGSGFWRFMDSGEYVDVPLHSEYVTYYVRMGVIGLSFFLMYLLRTFKGLWVASLHETGVFFPSASTWVALVATLLIYNFTYSLPADGYALIAMANTLLLKQTEGAQNPLSTWQANLSMKGM
jgi:hypothetical protein